MKLQLEDVTTGNSASKIISNFKRIQRFINYQTIKRQVEPGEPNEMWTYLVFEPVGGVCTTTADIILVVDNTGSQKQDEYYTLVLPAISNMIDSLVTLNRDVTLGSTVIKEVPYLLTPLSDNLVTTQTAINGLPAPAGGTSIADAITLAKAELDANGRTDVPGFIVIITDGVPNYANSLVALTEAEAAATAAKDAGYLVVVFGVMGQDLSDQAGGGIG